MALADTLDCKHVSQKEPVTLGTRELPYQPRMASSRLLFHKFLSRLRYYFEVTVIGSWVGGRRKEGRRCGRGDIESQQDVISSASSQRGRDAAKGQALAIRLQSLSGTGYPGELARARGLDTGRQSQARRPPREGTQLCGSLASPAEGPGSPPNGIPIR